MKCTTIMIDEKGSALSTVLIMLVIVTVFLGAVISGVFIQNRFIQQNINASQARYTAESGIYLFLVRTSYTDIVSDTTASFVIDDNNKAIITARPFGGFIEMYSTADYKGQKKIIRVLIGEEASDVFQNAVVLGDTTTELSVTGRTSIKGTILTGQFGVRTTNFKGYSFSGSLEGVQEKKKGALLPVYNSDFIAAQLEAFEYHFQKKSYPVAGYMNLFDSSLSAGDTLYFFENIFWNDENYIKMPDDITLFVSGNLIVNGNIELGMFNKIVVRDTLQISGNISGQHTLFYAGKSLQIGGAAKISCQCISGNEIVIRDDAYLQYPSFLYTEQEYNSTPQNEIIHIRGNSVVDGTIVYPAGQNQFSTENFKIKIDEKALVRGGIYTLGQTELSGKVYGSVLSRQFYFYESPTSYINWLKDVDIDISQRPEDYVIPVGFNNRPKYKVIEWMEIK